MTEFLDNLFVFLVYMVPMLLLFILGGLWDLFCQIDENLKRQKRIMQMRQNKALKAKLKKNLTF
jgi:hypothetical protein